MNKGFLFGVATTLLILLSIGGAYFLGTQSKKSKDVDVSTSEVTLSPTPQPQPTEVTIKQTNVPEGWLTYKNEEFGFEISYPENYKALDDSKNLYGWPNAAVLIYGGGQSYDLPIEVWDSEVEYKNKYPNQDNLTVKKVGDKYVTLLNMNFEVEVDLIIETFRESD